MRRRCRPALRWLVAILALPLLLNTPAAAAGKRAFLEAPRVALVGSPVHLKGRFPARGKSVRIVIQRRVRGRWRAIASKRLSGEARAVSIRWIAPTHPGPVRVRLVIRRAGRMTAASPSRLISVRTTVVQAVRRNSTREPRPAHVIGVTGDPKNLQFVTLDHASGRPHVGDVLEIPVSPAAPEGVLGTIAAVSSDTAGPITLEVQPTTLDRGYSSYHVRVSGTFQQLGASLVDSTGRTARTPARAGKMSPLSIPGGDLSCDGSGAGPAMSATMDFSAVHFDAFLNTSEPSLHFLISGRPKIDVEAGIEAKASCHYQGSLKVVVPIPGTPLQLVLRPEIEISSSGKLAARFSASPYLAIGFDKGGGRNQEVHSWNPGTPHVEFSGDASADVFLGAAAELSIGGRVGIGGAIGPALEFSRDGADLSCVHVEGSIRTELSAYADVFVKRWTFALARGKFFTKHLFDHCATAGGSGGSPNPPDDSGPAGPIGFASEVGEARLAMGYSYTCARLRPGSLKCWGLNEHGALGYGDETTRLAPPAETVDVGPGRTTQEITAGLGFTCALLDDHSVKCWGSNGYGELGYGIADPYYNRAAPPSQPINLGANRTARQVVAGGQHACVILDDYSVKCWGENDGGELGYGDTTSRSAPPSEVVDLGPGRTARQLAVSVSEYTCALLDDATVKCWGRNDWGQLGIDDTTSVYRASPPSVPIDFGGRKVLQISAGNEHTCALLDDGGVRCWGHDQAGQLGDGSRREQPVRVPPSQNIDLGSGRTAREISAGFSYTCALLDDGAVKCWGYNDVGQLGYGDTTDRSAPAAHGIDLGPGRSALHILVAQKDTCAVLDDATLKCWGQNESGELGYGDMTGRQAPDQQPIAIGAPMG